MSKERKTKIARRWDDLSERAQKLSKLISAVVIIGGFVIGCCNWGISEIKHAMDKHLESLESQVKSNSQELHEFKVESGIKLARMELMNLIADYPDNVDDILKAAEHYFLDLKGDYVADKAFEDWAKKHGVNPDYLLKLR